MMVLLNLVDAAAVVASKTGKGVTIVSCVLQYVFGGATASIPFTSEHEAFCGFICQGIRR